MSASDPFYLVKEEIQESADKVQATFDRWQQLPASSSERERLIKELSSDCESIEWQVEELERAIAVAERDPARFSVDQPEIDRRRKWTTQTRAQMATIRRGLSSATTGRSLASSKNADTRRELLRAPEGGAGAGAGRNAKPDLNIIRSNDDFIASESDRQALIMRAQDDDLEELSQHVERLGGVGLTIHEELQSQDRIITDLGSQIDTTANRLDYVQKKVASVIKKSGVKGQIFMIVFLLILVIILVLLIFYT